jgi:flagellar biosynthesis/type III secretory pathway chaperone
MTSRHHIASAPVIAGEKPSTNLATLYSAHKADPNSQTKLNQFGDHLNELLHRFFGENSQNGCLHQKESDIRQSAALMLLEGYLDGNKQLQAAVRSQALVTVENEIHRSTNAVLGILKKRMIRASQLEQITLDKFALINEPSVNGDKYLRTRDKMIVLLKAAQAAGGISVRNAKILKALIINERSREEVAKHYGLTVDAIAQIVHRTKEVLARIEPSIDM